MDNANARAEEPGAAPETPEDVAILYSWANLPGAKYRDFSASRREFRAQQRARMAEAQRQAELKAARELEEAAEREVQTAQREVEQTGAPDAKAAADVTQAAADAAAKRHAEDLLRRAEQRAERERAEALRRQQAAEELRVRAERAQQEMLEARKRAEDQAARYAEAQRPAEADAQTGSVPGETTDPYYYSGPVDPSYFAPTPGVRTAQATRTSTERQSPVHAAHPGSEGYDTGTAAPYRASHRFAPSPAQSSPVRSSEEELSAGPKSGDAERSRPWLYEAPGPQYDLDESYYHKGRATMLFAPSTRGKAAEATATVASSLHIRPARESSERAFTPRSLRRSPATVSAGRDHGVTQPEDRSTAANQDAEPDAQFRSVATAFRVTGGDDHFPPDTRRDDHDPLFAGAQDNSSMLPAPYRETGNAEDEDRSSRMFLPGPRRRFSQTHSRAAEDSVSHIASGWWQEGSGREDEQRSREQLPFTEIHDRRTQDRAVLEPETGNHDENDMLPAGAAMERSAREAEEPAPGRRMDASHWRPVSRMDRAEGGFRRRRQPAREPVARTARQPRSSHDADVHQEGGLISGEVSAPPAWLSEEPGGRNGAEEEKTSDHRLEDFPASPGDPDVPAPRQLPRRVSAGMRPRAALPATPEIASLAATRSVAAEGALAHDPSHSAEISMGERDAPVADTLQQSRERVASRWFALSGLMGAESRPGAEPRERAQTQPHPSPMLCVLSISGGVGKTSIVATLGRALSSLGEKVMLADTNVHGILPYYFGAREHRPGAVRTFSPPPGSSDAPVVLVSYDADGRGSDERGQKRLVEDLYHRAEEVERVLVDAGVNSVWLAKTLAGANPRILVPVAPDMNSVLGTQAVERLFQDVAGADGRPIKPYYVLNQYDPTMPLHLDVREVLRQFLGDRLLPIMLHRSPAVSEALAEGMTVMDYAPRTPIATDYMNLAKWVRQLADPGVSPARPARWSER